MTWYPRDAQVFTLKGKDTRDLIQRLTTNDVLKAPVGMWVQNVFTTEKGKLLAITSLLMRDDGMLVVVGGEAMPLMRYIDSMTFREDVDITPSNDRVVSSTEGSDVVLLAKGTHQIGGTADGDADTWDAWRIREGVPVWGRELTPERNPHEARLGDFIDWTKGCYVGQEVVARLDTYKKVQRGLIKLKAPRTGKLFLGDEEVGEITSARDGFALGYTKKEADAFSLEDATPATLIPW